MNAVEKFSSAVKKAIKGADVIVDEDDESVWVEYDAALYFKDRDTKRHPDAQVRAIAKKTGLLRKYEEAGSGMMIGGPRDISFQLK